jgi:proline dehydrogenase
MEMPDLTNTIIAFAPYDNRSLKRAFMLFRMVQRPLMVKAGKHLLKFATAIRFPVKWMVKPLIFRHFCGGENLEECKVKIQELQRWGVLSIPDFSAEGKGTEAHFERAAAEVMSTIEMAAVNTSVASAVFKTSGIIRTHVLEKMAAGLSLDEEETQAWNRGRERFAAICALAAQKGVSVMVDAEESWIQPAVDKLTEGMMHRYNSNFPVVYTTLQMYRTDRLAYLHRLCERFLKEGIIPAFKLVRGAYMEKERARAAAGGRPSPIYPDKKTTDRAYDEAARYCLRHPGRIALCLGTHNEKSVMLMVNEMQDTGLDPTSKYYCFAQLLGMSDHITMNLAGAGFRVAKYVPYGPVSLVLPYLIRRAEENTAVAGQTGRELLLLRKEINRRKAENS